MFQVIEFSPAAIAAYIAMVGILSIVAQVRDVRRSDFFAVVGPLQAGLRNQVQVSGPSSCVVIL